MALAIIKFNVIMKFKTVKIKKKPQPRDQSKIPVETTIDRLHNTKIRELDDKKRKEICLEKELNTLRDRLENVELKIIKNKNNSSCHDPKYSNLWVDKVKINESIIETNEQLQKIQNMDEYVDYFVKSSHILKMYYDRESVNDTQFTTDNIHLQALLEIDNSSEYIDTKKELYKRYKSILDEGVVEYDHIAESNDVSDDICDDCKLTMTVVSNEGYMFCPTCGSSKQYIIEKNVKTNSKMSPSSPDSLTRNITSTYRRINHFQEFLSQYQGKEFALISNDKIDNIRNEIRRRNIENPKDITADNFREILKSLGYNKLYEHTHYLMHKILNCEPPNFTIEQEERLRTMFKQIQDPFLKYCPPDRKNFLSYSYVTHKFCELLGMKEHLDSLKMLKDRKKNMQMDQVWVGICNELGWKYMPST